MRRGVFLVMIALEGTRGHVCFAGGDLLPSVPNTVFLSTTEDLFSLINPSKIILISFNCLVVRFSKIKACVNLGNTKDFMMVILQSINNRHYLKGWNISPC